MQDSPADPQESPLFELTKGNTPLLLNVPHAGTVVPDSLREALRPEALELSDTDWHMDRIARDLLPDGASLMTARITRYAVDLNRPPDDTPLYKGATTGLISTIDFDGNPLYRPGAEPDAEEQANRVAKWWTPYHKALGEEIERIRSKHGYCVMLDVHSIRGLIPRLFEGHLPDLNLGTYSGAACPQTLSDAAFAALKASTFSVVRDGRFKGGYNTRHYAQPAQKVFTMQIEIAQRCYMQEETPWTYLPEPAGRLKEALARLVAVLAGYRPDEEVS